MGILQETVDFLRLYLHVAGKDETPVGWHVWCCFSLVAAAVGNRVSLWFRKDAPLYPNLYTFLVGPSGVGKDSAISRMYNLFHYPGCDEECWRAINHYDGSLTAAYLIDKMGGVERGEGGEIVVRKVVNPRVFLITPEVSQAVKTKAMAKDFIKLVTRLFTSSLAPIQDGTRGGGTVYVENACLNWIAGTTETWLNDVMDESDLFGGPAARVIFAFEDPGFDRRVWRTKYPEDYEEVVEYLRQRVRYLTTVEGSFELDPAAEDRAEQWYCNRRPPRSEAEAAAWRRDREIVLKLAMLRSLMEGGELVVRVRHIQAGIQLLGKVRLAMPEVVEATGGGDRSSKAKIVVLRVLKKARKLERRELTKRVGCAPYNIRVRELDEILKDLCEQGRCKVERTKKGRLVYRWKG